MRFIIKSVLIGVAATAIVLCEGRSGYSLKSSPGQEIARLSFEEPVRVGGPVWAHVELPNNSQGMVQYPVGVEPDNLGCHEFEVRRNGVLLPRIVVRYLINVSGGLSCGVIGIPGRPMKHLGRLPLHLQYRFETPGIYEVRYTRSDGRGTEGVDVPYRITGNLAATVGVGDDVTIPIEVVRRQAKIDPPLTNIQQTTILTVQAQVTVFGKTISEKRVSATARMQIDFADFGDKDAACPTN